jgi:release factor glutamine methyltransferase
MSGASVRQVLREAETALRAAGVPSARADVEWLLADALGTGLAGVYLREDPVEPAVVERVRGHVARRAGGEPLQYLTGWTEFCGHRIQVDERVLIPRPETEVLVEAVVDRLRRRRWPAARILELGTGSGAIAIALAYKLSDCHITAGELSWLALQVASANITAHRMTDRIALVQADWTDGLLGRFDAIVANPPYVPTDRLARLPRDVQRQPRMSLDGGPDGLRFHRRLLAAADGVLAPGGLIAMECDEDHAHALRREAAARAGVREARVLSDLAGRARAVLIATADRSERVPA